MSVFQFQATGATPILVAVTSNAATDIVDASLKAVVVAWFEVNENAGTAQNLTVSLTNGTTTIYLGDDNGDVWRAKAVTANKSYKFTQGYPVPYGWKLQVTSSDAAGKFHVVGSMQRTP